MSVLVMDLQQLTAHLIMVCNLCQSFLQMRKKKEEAHCEAPLPAMGEVALADTDF